MAAACASFARPHSTTANNPDARPSTGSARQRLFPRQILIAAAIACARADSTIHETHMNASPTAAVALFRLTMKAVPWVTLKAISRLIHSRFRSAAAVALSRFATSMLFISPARSRLSLSPLATLSLHVAAERFLAHSGLSE